MKITIMTYNIHHGKNTNNQLNLDRIAKVMERSNADIIGLNEVDKNFSKRSEFEDQIGWLAKQLGMEQAFTPSIRLKSKGREVERQYGNALLSNYPIIRKKDHHFNFVKGLVEGRSLLEATIQINKEILKVYITHLSLNPFLQHKQTNYMMKRLAESQYPTIMMGDWNMKPNSGVWKKVTEVLDDAWDQSGKGTGHTYPSLRPKRRLDYIFVSSGVSVQSAETVMEIPEASDHLPLKVTVKI